MALTMANPALPFAYDDKIVRVFTIDGDPWFVLADVCAALGIKNASNVAARLDDDEKMLINTVTGLPIRSETVGMADGLVQQTLHGVEGLRLETLHAMEGLGSETLHDVEGLAQADPAKATGGRNRAIAINESGFYRLALNSPKPEARRFTKWVTSELLPTLRKTGRYETSPARNAQALSNERAAARKELPVLIKTLRGERTATVRTMIHGIITQHCEALGLEVPPLDDIGARAPNVAEIVAPFFAGIAALEAMGVEIDHHRRADRSAYNLPQLGRLFKQHGQPVTIDKRLIEALKACEAPQFLEHAAVHSIIARKTVHALVFLRD